MKPRPVVQPILEAIPAARQQEARHYGVHPYFTRRPANVVRAYLERYSREGDVVLDPFGGTGVTAIEAFLLGRKAIQNDLNPFANFIARAIVDTTLASTLPLQAAFEAVRQACEKGLSEIEKNDDAARSWLKRLPLPENIRLPRTSDAGFFYDLFTPRQLAGLALIKQSIEREAAGVARELLLLAWSASVAKLNRTFLSAKGRAESRGGSSIFSIYRYKLASQCVELPIWDTFHGRYRNVLAAKQEVLKLAYCRNLRSGASVHLDSAENFKVLACDAGSLDHALEPGSVDYIFTDPPYGGFITYLDLSILWNHWLGFPVSHEARDSETIVGGECGHSQEHYKKGLARSIRTSLQLLRPDRWFSIVFQHWDLSYFATILETAGECGAELRAAITQTGDVIWSMHKKKNSASVLAGEMILTFFKPKRPRKPVPAPQDRPGRDPAQVLSEVFDVCLADGTNSFASEALFNRLIIELWRRRELACLTLDRAEFSGRLEQRGWTYDTKTHLWSRGGSRPSGREELALFRA
ncbi:MAG TPA: DNA methyltransferase [Dongiaceae bacterium]|nr:DNA methyltransferase [Dongiaceae bacterium]